MKLVAWCVSVALAASAGIYSYAGSVTTGKPGTYGAYRCMTSCQLGTSAPDRPTLEYLNVMDSHLQEDSAYRRMPGDVFLICNAAICVNYSRSDDPYNYIGGPRIPVNQVIPSPGGGGSGGPDGGGNGGGGGGGVPNPGGCAPKCTGGTVIVRDPGKA
ncbi:hypothetical protein [Lysobacter enzymogenes]|uniref:hypothetical protein n=1 Tax=Lysobacter enzymogenes TaxID=69 RepID=UPI0019D07E69|nr:hypothetical protein [Lysobacter enzymogenes]